jgi:hypothetical protein
MRLFRPTVLVALACLSQACAGAPPEPPLVVALTRGSTQAPAETLHVRPPELAGLGAPYPGKSLDTALYGAFAGQYPELKDRRPDELSTLFQVALGHGRTGFVLRVPSQYSSTAADLWVYDRDRRAWERPVHLADAFGDGAWEFSEDGWIVDVDGDGYRDVVRRRRDAWVDEGTDAPGHSDSLWVSRGGPHGFAAARPSADPRLLAAFDVEGWAQTDTEPARTTRRQ